MRLEVTDYTMLDAETHEFLTKLPDNTVLIINGVTYDCVPQAHHVHQHLSGALDFSFEFMTVRREDDKV